MQTLDTVISSPSGPTAFPPEITTVYALTGGLVDPRDRLDTLKKVKISRSSWDLNCHPPVVQHLTKSPTTPSVSDCQPAVSVSTALLFVLVQLQNVARLIVQFLVNFNCPSSAVSELNKTGTVL